MSNLIRLVLIIGLGSCFAFGHWKYLLGASLAVVMILLKDIRDEL